jgi:hypothetical protein
MSCKASTLDGSASLLHGFRIETQIETELTPHMGEFLRVRGAGNRPFW